MALTATVQKLLYQTQAEKKRTKFLSKQTLLAMKFIMIFLTVACLHVHAKGYAQNISLSVRNESLAKVIAILKQQTGYEFFYNESLLKNAKPVTISVKDMPVEQVLERCFKDQPLLTYSIIAHTVVIKDKPQSSNLSTPLSTGSDDNLPPPIDVHGRIVNEKGEPVIASVQVKGTGKGTTSNDNGEFELKGVDDNATLVISGVSIETFEVKVNGRSELALGAKMKNIQSEEVTVSTGYWTTTRRLSTGNIVKVTAEEIEKQPVMNPLQALQGRVPGLVVTQTSGYASAPFKVELRGRNNINGLFTSEPLYIIDGVPITISDVAGNSSYLSGSTGFLQNSIYTPAGGQSPLFSISPDEIESIEVLKDADATSIYGSRAANGVILITTKKGKAGKIKIDGSFSQGISAVTRKWEMLNTQQYLQMRREAFTNDGISMNQFNAYDLLKWDTTQYTDWQKYVWGRKGHTTEAQLSLSGGNNQITYRVAAGYNRATEITTAKGADERLAMSSNMEYKTPDQRFNISFNNTYSFSKSDMVFLPGGSTPLLSPNAPDVFDSTGKLNFLGWKPGGYPFSNLFQPYSSKTKFLNSNLVLEYKITKALKLRTSLGYNNTTVNQTLLTPISSLDPTRGFQQTGAASFGNNQISNWIIEPQIAYTKVITKSKVDILGGATVQKNFTEGSDVNGDGYTTDFLLNSISNAPNQYANDFSGQYRYAGLFARANYNYANKYLINLSARRDGSSRFGEGKQFGNFGAVGGAWIISEEKFLKSRSSFLSFAKIRGSYGTTGNDAIGDYKYLTRWSSSGTVPYSGVSPLVPLQHSNTRYHWSTNRKLETAIDIGLLRDKIAISVAWYRNRCNDQLLSFPIASYTGFGTVTANSPANVQNTGWEFNVTGKIVNTKNFSWNLTFNSGVNRNKLISYPNLAQSPYAQLLIVGQPLNLVRLLHYTGVDPQTGLYTVEDKNKDGNISTSYGNGDDRYVHAIDPNLTGGFGTSIYYSGIDITLFFTAVKQKFGINAFSTRGATPGGINNTSQYIFDNRWQKPGDISQFAKFTTIPDNSFSYFYNSDGVYTDASYIRLSTIAVSYSMPSNIAKKIGFESLRFTINAQNIMTITKYKGIDPETQNFGGMPPAKVITAGINFNF